MEFVGLAALGLIGAAGIAGYNYANATANIEFELPAGAVGLEGYDLKEDLLHQSEHIGDGVYRRTAFRRELKTTIFDDVTTLYGSLQRGARLFPNANCLGYRPIDPQTGVAGDYKWITYRDTLTRVTNFGCGLVHLGFEQGKDHLGIYSKNRAEWTIASEACSTQSLVTVALYDTFGKENVSYIIDHAELKGIVVNYDVFPKLVECLGDRQTDLLKYIIIMPAPGGNNEALNPHIEKCRNQYNLKVFVFEEIERLGEQHPCPHTPPNPEDLAIIMYTSGTTGKPKGVMMKHKNIIATQAGVLDNVLNITDKDVFPSYLPLAHILQRACENAVLGLGVAIGYWQGDVTKLMDDLQVMRPTIMAAVPRVLERIKSGLEQRIESGPALQKFLFKYAIEQKKKALAQGRTCPFWDKLVFSQVRQKIGGRLRGFLCGGAALRKETQEFISMVFGCPVAQGYGLTESCAGATFSLYWDTTSYGTIGPPISCCDLKLFDVPEMGYLATNDPPQGEIGIRGENVFPGYYKDEKMTAEVFKDGFFLTGDIGQYNPNGTFSIIDRKKNLVKLPQGEYVALERVETQCLASKFVEQIYVHADLHEQHLVAVVIPQKDFTLSYAKSKGYSSDTDSLGELCKNEQLKKVVVQDIQQNQRKEGAHGFELIRAVHLDTCPFTVENNLMTPSMKLKRRELSNKYNKEIKQMFDALRQQ